MSTAAQLPARVLLTGGSGQLGRDLVSTFEGRGWRVDAPAHVDLDITVRASVLSAVAESQPDVVVNAAAWCDPKGCEDDPGRAYAVHALGVRHLGEACRATGAHLCQISSDYVFDGNPTRSHTEWDEAAPVSVYGRSKRGGEIEAPDGSTIVRTSRLVSAQGNNVGRNVMRLAAENPDQQFRFDATHKGCVTFTTDLAATIESLCAARLPGVYHVTNQGVTTWFEFARSVLELAGHDPTRVQPLAVPIGAGVVPRPEYSVLDNVAVSAAGVGLLPVWQASLPRFVAALAG